MRSTKYSRAEAVELIGAAGLARLQQPRVAVAGAGQLGGELLRHLSLLGMSAKVIDRDTVKEENLAAQGFPEACLGMAKAEARAAALRALNPDCRMEPVVADIERLGLGFLHDVELIFCCLDSRNARLTVNEMATWLGIPYVDAALDGSGRTLFGRVAAYDPAHGSACYLCPYDSAALAEIQREGMGERCPAGLWRERPEAAPTVALSASAAAVAAAQFVWGLRILLGSGAEVIGRELYLDLGAGACSVQRLQPNPRCLFGHRRLELTELAGSPESLTVGETFRRAEEMLGGEVTIELRRRTIMTGLRCPGCGARRTANRLLEAMRPAEARCACGGGMQPAATDLLDRFGREQARPFLGLTWRDLGLPPRDVVTAVRGQAQVHLLIG